MAKELASSPIHADLESATLNRLAAVGGRSLDRRHGGRFPSVHFPLKMSI
jgi:hypothetical protein